MAKKHMKVVVTGAAGQIGYALLFRIANGDMFGKDTTLDLQLLELEHSLPTLHGVAMELYDCAFPLLRTIVSTADLRVAMKGVNAAVLVGSVPRKAGMERADLLKINGAIFKAQGQAINDYADENVRIFVVGNPCNTNCLIAMHHAKEVPNERFFAMTTLDEKRARSQLALKAGVSVTEVKKMVIWGNHSSTQFPDFYQATIAGKPVITRLDEDWLKTEFITSVQQRGAAVIQARGASSAASAANAAIAGVYALFHDTAAEDYYSMALCSQGEYGVEPGLLFSFPCQTVNGHIEVVTGISHNEFAQQKIKASEAELRAEKQAVIDLGLL